MSVNKYFNNLFNKGDGVCMGGYKATDVEAYTGVGESVGNFVCVNPLDSDLDHGHELKSYYRVDKPRRADINVTELRSFVFEMDSVDLETQLEILENCGIPFSSITYSGSKSYHAVLSLSASVSDVPHTDEGITSYKHTWQRLRAKIDRSGYDLGFEPPSGKSFVDSSCQNPSRLTRIPGAIRENGRIQELVHIGERISMQEFLQLIDKCPEIAQNDDRGVVIGDAVETTSEFWRTCPIGLKNKLRYVDWADSAGMYPELLRLTYWAIDSTGVPIDVFLDALWDKTFPKLMKAGYPEEKLTVAVKDAYAEKRRK